MNKQRGLTVLVVGVLLFTGCGGGGTSTDDATIPSNRSTGATNKAPMVNAGADKTVTVNEAVTLVGTATDSDGTISSIEWKKGKDVLGTTLTFSYTPTVVGTEVLMLVAVDDDGVTASDEVKVVVEEDTGGKRLPAFSKIK
jgi:hypothetical protein